MHAADTLRHGLGLDNLKGSTVELAVDGKSIPDVTVTLGAKGELLGKSFSPYLSACAKLMRAADVSPWHPALLLEVRKS